MTDQFLRFASGFLVDTGRLAIWLVLLVAIFVPLEYLCGLEREKFWRKQLGVDLAWYFINSLLPATVLSIPLALIARVLGMLDPGGYFSLVAHLPFWWKVLLVLLVSDIGAYWGHRALHVYPWLWRFHAVHHSAEEMDWLVNTRAHPFDIIFVRFAGLAPVYLLGLAQTGGGRLDPAVTLLMIFGTIWTFFIHANMRVRLGPLEWLISSPAFHHWHHTKNEHRDRNFAFVFPLIDRLFGTAWLPKHWPSAYGTNAKVPTTVIGQLFNPLGKKRGPTGVSSEKDSMIPVGANQGDNAQARVASGMSP